MGKVGSIIGHKIDGAKRCKKRKKARGGLGGEVPPYFFSRSLTSRCTPNPNAWKRPTVTTRSRLLRYLEGFSYDLEKWFR